MKNRIEWYADEESLLGELRNTRSHWGQFPEIAGYDRIVEIERGGQGVIYRARQCATGKTVAIKVLLDGFFASSDNRLRFEREIESVRLLHHPGIVRVLDSGAASDHCLFYVMDYVDGVPIDDATLFSSNDIRPKLTLFIEICEAVRHAHQHGVIHRDLKPGNILVDTHGAVHVLDFGLAKYTEEALSRYEENHESTPLSRTGQFLGSLAWASPEQIDEAPDRIDVRTDVYSLGVVLYQLLTGQLPHAISSNLRQTLNEISTVPPVRPSLLRQGLSDDVETVVLRCLAKEPDRRYQTVHDLKRDIDRYLAGEPIEAKRDRVGYVLRKTMGRHKAVTGLVVALLVIIIGFSLAMTVLYREARENLSIAMEQQAKSSAVQEFLKGILSLSDPCTWSEMSLPMQSMLDSAMLNMGDRFARHPEIEAEIRYVVADAYFHLNRFDDALANYHQALDQFRSVYGEEHPDVAKVMCKLADVNTSGGHLEESESLLKRALEICTDRFGENDYRVADGLRYLADLRSAQNRNDEAQTLYRRAYLIYVEHVDFHDMRMLKTLYHWSNLLIKLGLYEDALEKLGQLTEIHEAHPDENKWVGSVIPLNHGKIKLALREFESAASYLETAVERARKIFGDTHLFVADLQLALGHAYFYLHEYSKADENYGCALKVQETLRGRESLGVAHCLFTVACLRWAQEDFPGAETVFREAIAMLRKLDQGRYLLSESLLRLGRMMGEEGQWETALPLLKEAMQIRITEYGEEQVITSRARALLGECHLKLKDFEKAEALLLEAFDQLRSRELPTYMRHLLTNLIELYEALDKTDMKEKYQEVLSTLPPVESD